MQGVYRHHRTLAALVLGSAVLAGCETSPTQEDMGTGLGALIGGLVGSQIGKGSGKTVAVVGGAILGAVVGRSIGRYMDDNDKRRLGEALDSTPTGETVAWSNSDSGYDFKMTPVRDYQSPQGYPCREFMQQVVVDGELKTVDGSACKEPDKLVWTST